MQETARIGADNRGGAKADKKIEKQLATLAEGLLEDQSLEVRLPDGAFLRIGKGALAFRANIHNERGLKALKSLDESRIGEAYLNGDIDLEGDLVAALNLRAKLNDCHPLLYLWSTYGERLFFGQVSCDKKWISEHYDEEPDFYKLFLDKAARCYSHGYFESDDEPLESAIERKLDTAFSACGIREGWRVLDIGAGWGAFSEYAGKRGAQVTSLTISVESERFVNELIRRQSLPCHVIREHFLDYRTDKPFDAIVNLGVTEHLPDYAATLAQYKRLLKPGGRVFLDASASRRKHPFSSFVLKHVWPGNTTPLQLDHYLKEVAKTPFEILYVRNDRHNYMLTTKRWAENLDRHRDEIIRRWSEPLYRRFRLYLWGCVQAFSTGDVTAYRLLLELPREAFARALDHRRRFFSLGKSKSPCDPD